MTLDKEKIEAQAKAIMDEFVKALDKVGELSGPAGIDREKTTRKGKASKPDEDFRKRMLDNAPRKDSDHIIAERKTW